MGDWFICNWWHRLMALCWLEIFKSPVIATQVCVMPLVYLVISLSCHLSLAGYCLLKITGMNWQHNNLYRIFHAWLQCATFWHTAIGSAFLTSRVNTVCCNSGCSVVVVKVSVFSTWEKELHKIVFDHRYLLLPSKERKQVYEQYIRDRADEERREKSRKLRQKKDDFRQLLSESKIHNRFVALVTGDIVYGSIQTSVLLSVVSVWTSLLLWCKSCTKVEN